MLIDVGARLQSVRTQKGLSQRELAKRAGVTNSTISLIEQNRVSPSVSSLKKVLDGIPISLAEFFTFDQDVGALDKVVYSAEEQPDVGSAGVHYFLLAADRLNRQMEIFREVMPPGADTGDEMLSYEGEEGGIVMQGELELISGERSHRLGPGDGYYIDCKVPHRFRSVGSEDLLIVSATTPPTF